MSANFNIETLNLAVLSHSAMVHANTYHVNGVTKNYQFKLEVTSEMQPVVNVIVYSIIGGKIILDYQKIHLRLHLENFVR